MKILVTGSAGFIGAALSKRLLREGHKVVGIDILNDYYDPDLKIARLRDCGLPIRSLSDIAIAQSVSNSDDSYRFIRLDIADTAEIARLFEEEKFDVVVNLAAQAGVRYSIQNPAAYIHSNIDGFLNILEGCRHTGVRHLVYASSSSVYGLNGKVPFSEHDGIAHPVSLYAATKKSNELMAHCYSMLYSIPTTGLRFFTVYGPWGRPDMSPFLFMDAIFNDRPIKVFNKGNMLRDFTYIDDIVEGIARIIHVIPQGSDVWDGENPDPAVSPAPYRIYNIGNSQPVKLMDYIECIERSVGKEACKEYLPMQPGDVYQTYADSSALAEATGFKPSTPLQEGIDKTVEWYRNQFIEKSEK